MAFKDDDYVPKLWSYDTTGKATVLSRGELKKLRDELNEEYLRRWSGYNSDSSKASHKNDIYSDYNGKSTQFTDADGKHIHRLPSWNGELPEPTKNTSKDSRYTMADGNIDATYWKNSGAHKDYRGCPVYYSPLDRYIDGSIFYDVKKDIAPKVTSDYTGPEQGKTFPLGTSEWRNSEQYRPHGVTDVTKDRSFKHLIDGLCNIVDIDKYFGVGIMEGDPVNQYNKVNYGEGQDPKNSERVGHVLRQTGFVDDSTVGSITGWINQLKTEQRNEYYIRACNYQHWIWYFADVTYTSGWTENPGSGSANRPTPHSYRRPAASTVTPPTYSKKTSTTKVRKNYNPSYYGHRESYTSCQIACTGFCSQTCYHVCDEQCVYLCDDKCGYSCMSYGQNASCGSSCISNCLEFCGGRMQNGSFGGNECSSACKTKTGNTISCAECKGSCQRYTMDGQACSDCHGFCSNGCDTICVKDCAWTCGSDPCNISCRTSTTGHS